MKKTELDSFAQVLAQKDAWTILGHANPDGDCIGAVTAMGLVLKSMGKEVSILVEDGLPSRYQFLPGSL
ncbi:MAG: bifunctional oligoribonuclease/PAP phosphatase NrnA, partial [Syntrophomonadaceae bacterium]|nr:bifunctional oligoribonuclease/PAP phosphatase NrnA [Syntrophomonadaceae bacterium]